MCAESSHRPIDDQNSAARLDHLWTNLDKYTPKSETHDVIIYGQKDRNGTADERRSTPIDAGHDSPTHTNPRPSAFIGG
jgi:hypothetical protein